MSNGTLLGVVGVWAVVLALIVRRQRRHPGIGVGLVPAYILNLALIHGVATAAYLLPNYPRRDFHLASLGIELTTFGLAAFAAGALLASQLLPPFPLNRPAYGAHSSRLPVAYLMCGLVGFLILLPITILIPTLGALVSATWGLVTAGIALGCWSAWHAKRRTAFLLWLTAGCALPMLTIVSIGYVGYGTAATLTVAAFVATFYRPRWKLLLGAGLLTYVGLSLFVTYMRDRDLLRSVAWGGAPISIRVERLAESLSAAAAFDPSSPAHLAMIDDRLNQNYLVGVAVDYVNRGQASYAKGETIWQAALSVIPRALWSEKPVRAGGSAIVTRYTGIQFAEGTSVGAGQVMEFYVNYGVVGVVIGFAIWGAFLTLLDAGAGRCLGRGDFKGFALWLLPGMACLQVGGALAEVTASAAAALVTVAMINGVLPRLVHDAAQHQRRPAAAWIRSGTAMRNAR